MKKIISLILVAIMVLSFSAIAFAASPETGTVTPATPAKPAKPVAVAEPSSEGKAALEAAIADQLKGKIGEGQTPEVVASFSCTAAGKVEANAAGVKTGDTVYVLFRDAKGNIRLIKGVAKDGKVVFNVPGPGDFTIVKVAGGEKTVPSTGDSNRMMKLVFVGIVAVSVMALAGVAIKRTNI